MTDLKSLFTTPEEAVNELQDVDFQSAFEDIINIRKQLFNEEEFFEIMCSLTEMGVIPKTSYGIPYKYCKFDYLYERLSITEVRLMQVKSYVLKERKGNNKKPAMFNWII